MKSVREEEQKILQSQTKRSNPPQQPIQFNAEARLNITEPPPNSFVMGETLSVAIDIQPYNKNDFLSVYENSIDAKVCVSLDSNPYLCWPALTGRIFFSGTSEGKHKLEAMLYNDGELKKESRSATSFTTVHDHGDTIVAGQDEQVTGKPNLEEDPTTGEQIHVEFPAVKISSPAANVTYPGTSVSISTVIEPTDAALFELYFKKAFVCVNIDSSSAYSCFSIFGEDKYAPPLVRGLDNGPHIIKAGLSHPETGEILLDSFSQVSTFFTAGELNEAASIAVEVNVSGRKHIIPMVEGSNFDAQTAAFCTDVQMAKNPSCTERIKAKLVGAAAGMN